MRKDMEGLLARLVHTIAYNEEGVWTTESTHGILAWNENHPQRHVRAYYVYNEHERRRADAEEWFTGLYQTHPEWSIDSWVVKEHLLGFSFQHAGKNYTGTHDE